MILPNGICLLAMGSLPLEQFISLVLSGVFALNVSLRAIRAGPVAIAPTFLLPTGPTR